MPREVVKVRHTGRITAQAIVALLVAAVAWSVVGNERFHWDVVWHYFASERVINGLWITLYLTVVSMALGGVLGVIVAVMRNSPSRLISGLAGAYIWFFRSTPLLIQLIFWFNISALYPTISLGVPFGGPTFLDLDANTYITPLVAAVLGLSFNEASYLAEIVRGGILSVDRGQLDASTAVGMSRLQALRHVVLPQAIRVIIPPTGNQLINMLKATSLVSVVAVADLLYSVELIYTVNYQTIPLLIVACFWYMIFTTILTIGQTYLERHFSRSLGSPPTRKRSFLFGFPGRTATSERVLAEVRS